MTLGGPAATAPARHITESDWQAARATIDNLPRDAPILVACHVNPDGDALGSMLGFAFGLRQLGFTRVQASFPTPFQVAEPLRFLPGLDLLVPPDQVVRAPALGMSFDAASPARLGELLGPLTAATDWIVVDHHASNSGFGTLPLIDAGAAATAVVAVGLLDRLGVGFDQPMATCLYVALATDTGSFKYDATTPETHTLAARLLAAGVRPAEVSRQVFDTRPYGALRLLADVLGRAELDPAGAGGRGLVVTHATLADLERHGQPAAVVESFIDVLRSTAEADVACLIKPVQPGEWAVSLRSKGATDVAAIAIGLGGGGHRLAAGFTGRGELADVVATVRDRLRRDESGFTGGR